MKNNYTPPCLILILSFSIFSISLFSQNVGINTMGATPDASAMLDIVSTSKGLLIPRVALTATNSAGPIASPLTSLLVYNTATAGISPNNVLPGYYYWNGTKWISTGGNDWSLLGNAATVDGTNFLGTIDNVALNFRVNNQPSGRIDPTGAVFLGYQSGNGTNDPLSLAIGFQALQTNTSGTQNTGVGYQTIQTNTTGTFNTACGTWALNLNTTGDNNTAVGAEALTYSMTGSGNTAVGSGALIFSGFTADGNNNTAIGTYALRFIGHLASPAGSDNTALGYYAGDNLTTGSGNTYIGSGAECPVVSSGSFTNSTAIGFNAIVSASNSMVFGNSSVTKWGFGTNTSAGNIIEFPTSLTTAKLTTAGVWTDASDSTLKTNIKNLNYGLSEILKLNPVSYTMKSDGKKEIGFIAQEVKKIIPEVVYGEEGGLSMSYGHVVAVLVQAMKEQQKIIQELQKTTEQLQSENGSMKTDMLLLKASVNNNNNIEQKMVTTAEK